MKGKETHVLYGFDGGGTDRGPSASRKTREKGKEGNRSNEVVALLRSLDQHPRT